MTKPFFLAAILSTIMTIAAFTYADPPGPAPMPSAGATSNSQPASNTATPGSPTSATLGKPNAQGFFYIYADKASKDNHFVPSGWMGDYGDIKIDDASKEKPHSAPTCFKITYNGHAAQGANWAGIFWQTPANNWGEKPGGFDLTRYKKLTFWARGAKGGEKIAEFKVGGITGEHGDSDSASIGPIALTSQWKKYTIGLADKNLSHIVGGFAWSASRDDNPNGFVIYLDDIRFES